MGSMEHATTTGEEEMKVDIKDSELLPCPFCGDAAQIEQKGDVEDIACLNIYCLVQPRALGATTKAARETWNTRHVEN